MIKTSNRFGNMLADGITMRYESLPVPITIGIPADEQI